MPSRRLFIILVICLFYVSSSSYLASSLNSSITRREIHVQPYLTTSYYKTSRAYSYQVEREDGDTEATSNFKSWRGQSFTNIYHQHSPLKVAQGLLSVIGWGTLLPIGAIIARYFRRFPMHWDEWSSVHVICQTGGYFLGSIGWFVGLLASNKHHSDDKPHRILGIIIFTFTTIQMFAIFWQPKTDQCFRKIWVIYHCLLGYALIAMIIAEIFIGFKYQNHATKWRWTYLGFVGVLGLVAIPLEIYRWCKTKISRDPVDLSSNIYINP